jgi:starvation-inducible DNA-binding protein
MNPLLAVLIQLRYDAYYSHWNVSGPFFNSLHHLFEQLAHDINPFIDEVAERNRYLGDLALGSIYNVVENSPLPPYNPEGNYLIGMMTQYAFSVEYVKSIFHDYERDVVTQDLLTRILNELEHKLWLLKSNI